MQLGSIDMPWPLPAVVTSVVDGAWTGGAGDGRIPVEDPATLDGLAVVADAGSDGVEVAVRAADRAFRTVWRHTAPVERGRVLLRLAATVRTHAAALARLESLDTGKPLNQASADVATAARYFEYFAGVADKILGETLPQPSGSFAYTVREPYGVVAHITPWNSPISQLCRGVAPSLAAGNTVVVKPSELAPLSSLVAARLFVEAGLPPGVCNVVPGYGPTTGTALVAHPLVRHVTFTGSVPTGRAVLHAAADRIVPCSLELGGKSPTIVLADADLTAAAQAGIRAVVRNSGQSCFATTRILAHHRIHDELVDRISAGVDRLRVGRGLDDPDLGPLISARQKETVGWYLRSALDEGAQVATADRAGVDLPGHFVDPVVLVGVRNDMRVAREEVFGPVQCVLAFHDEDEAVAIANDTEYGLAAGVFTRDVSAVHRLAARLEVGQVQVNEFPVGGVDTPFGGYKSSGIGREKGLAALAYYTQLKTVVLAYQPVAPAG